MRWVWNEDKNEANKRKHGLRFEAAQYVFSDPLALTRLDSYPDEERYQTIGLTGRQVILVVHTLPKRSETNGSTGRIISARKATAREKNAYEEGTF